LTEPLQVGQFAIVDTEPVDRGPNAGVFHGKGPTDDRAELFIVAEGTTPAGEAFAGHVVSALGHAFNTLDMSLTGSLQRLFEEAERNLLDWNRKSIAQHRVSIGLSAFGRRGTQAVIAQAGPSVVYHYHDDRVDTYFPDEEHGRPIGAGPVKTQLRRIEFGPGHRILMISTSALRELDDDLIEGILALPGPQVLQDLFRRLQHVRQMTAVLINGPLGAPGLPPADEEFVIDATAGLPAPHTNDPTGAADAVIADNTFQPSLFIDDEAQDAVATARKLLLDVTPRRQMERAVPAVVAEMPAPLLRVSGESPLARIAAERQARAAMAQASLAALTPALTRSPGWSVAGSGGRSNSDSGSNSQSIRRRHDRRDSFSRGLVHDEVPARPSPVVEAMPLVDDMAAELRSHNAIAAPATETIANDATATLNSGGTLVQLRGNMGGRWRASHGFSRRSAATASLPPTWLVIVVGLGVLLALVGVFTVPKLLNEQSSQRYASLLDGAQQRLSISRVQQDPAQRREALSQAQALLFEARDDQPNDASAASILADVNAALAGMDAIKNPAAVEVIASLDQFGDKPVNVSRLAVGDDTGYVLDSASSQVIAMTYATGDRKVVFGEDKTKNHGRPVAMAFMDSADFGASDIIADSAHNLWAYTPASGIAQLAFAAPTGITVTDIAVKGRDLYVLDANQSVVYRFTQGDAGFPTAPTAVLNSPDLAAARRLMVDDDIVTADANGRLHTFSGQLSLELSQGGIDKKLVADATPQDVTLNGDLAFLDAPNDRIIVLHRDGTFAYQWRHKDFRASSAFVMRDGVGYLFSDGKLRKVTF
jgi:hypothetical protein